MSQVTLSHILHHHQEVSETLNQVLHFAVKHHATDIHFTPQGQDAYISLRIHHRITSKHSIPSALHTHIIGYLKVVAKLDMIENRIVQEGGFTEDGVHCRLSILPTCYGERAVIRIHRPEIITLEDLGLPTAVYQRLIQCQQGICLFSGKTNSGKNTSAYACLEHWKQKNLNIMTVEDPIEYPITGITQSAVFPALGNSYETLLKAMMRQDPDILFLGECRDENSAQALVNASLSGHLIYSTLHAGSVLQTLERLQRWQVLFDACLFQAPTIIHQTLLPQLCHHCRQPHAGFYITGPGCRQCDHGISGRVLLVELDHPTAMTALSTPSTLPDYLQQRHDQLQNQLTPLLLQGEIDYQLAQHLSQGWHPC